MRFASARRLVLTSALACALAVFPAGWRPTNAQVGDTPKRGGTLVFDITNGEPPNYDCAANTASSVLYRVAPHYSTLIKISQTNYPEIIGDAAESWTVSADFLSYRFTLRPNIRFHDGSLLTSADVKATYERIMRPPAGVVSVRQQLYQDIVAIEAPDERTIVFQLTKPNAAMLTLFASPWNCLYSARKLADDSRFPERNVLGTGPFRFVRHVAGSEWVGERFEGYFRAGQPYLDGFKAINMAATAAVNAMSAGQIDIDFRGVTLQERDRILAAQGVRMRAGEVDQTFYMALTFNTQRPAFSDPRVRRALNIAIDRWGGSAFLARTSLLNGVGGMLRAGSQFALPREDLQKMPGFGTDMAASRAEARRLLAEAGQSDLKLTLMYRGDFAPLGIFLIDQWRQIGVTAVPDQPDNTRLFSSINSGNFEVVIDGTLDYVDEPVLQFQAMPSSDVNPNNRARMIDRKVDDLYERQMRSTDAGERRQLIRELEAHLLNEAYRVPLFWSKRYTIMSKDLRGYDVNAPSNLLGQDLVDLWFDR